MKKRALITGITGQDGPYLAEILTSQGYEITGLTRQQADLTNAPMLAKAVSSARPDEIYNLAGQSSVRRSFDNPEETFSSTGLGALNLLEAARQYQDASGRSVKFFQACSSEMFGAAPAPQNEQTQFLPQSPYARAKVFAFEAVRRFRQDYSLFAVSGILFNHESPRRPENFVTRKITLAAASISLGLSRKLTVGNLEIERDWGYAPEYMEAARLMLQAKQPEDYVVGTGVAHTLRDFLSVAFNAVGIVDFEKYIETDPALYRRAEVVRTVADPRKIHQQLGWQAKTSFAQLVRLMVQADLEYLKKKLK